MPAPDGHVVISSREIGFRETSPRAASRTYALTFYHLFWANTSRGIDLDTKFSANNGFVFAFFYYLQCQAAKPVILSKL